MASSQGRKRLSTSNTVAPPKSEEAGESDLSLRDQLTENWQEDRKLAKLRLPVGRFRIVLVYKVTYLEKIADSFRS